MFELRIDLVGDGWREVAGRLRKPWIACNRRQEEGGSWHGSEPARLKELITAVDLGAATVDIELATPGLTDVVKVIKGGAACLISYHNTVATPPLAELKRVLENELGAGADICKVVTTAREPADNATVLELIKAFPAARVVAFAMGAAGQLSRVLGPLMGSPFAYASVAAGRESAAGQLTVKELHNI
jgi:3-dehydroquinate dehydratase type I